MNKTNYTKEAMIKAVHDYFDRMCDECYARKEYARYKGLEEQGRVVAIAEWEDYSEIRDNTVCGRAEVKYKRCSNCKQPMGLSGDRHCGSCGAIMKGNKDADR